MKYLFILPITFFVLSATGQSNRSPDTENCHYRTEDSHLTSNNYSRLLNQITQSAEERKKKKKRKQRPAGSGQR